MVQEWFFCFTASRWGAFVVRYKKCNTVITQAFYYNKCWQKKADEASFSSELSNHTDDGNMLNELYMYSIQRYSIQIRFKERSFMSFLNRIWVAGGEAIIVYMCVNILIASADRIRLSADALIVFLNAIRKNMSGEGFALSYKLFFSGGEGYNIFSNAKRSVFSVVPRW